MKTDSSKFKTKVYVDSSELSTYTSDFIVPPFIHTSFSALGKAGYSAMFSVKHMGSKKRILQFYNKSKILSFHIKNSLIPEYSYCYIEELTYIFLQSPGKFNVVFKSETTCDEYISKLIKEMYELKKRNAVLTLQNYDDAITHDSLQKSFDQFKNQSDVDVLKYMNIRNLSNLENLNNYDNDFSLSALNVA